LKLVKRDDVKFISRYGTFEEGTNDPIKIQGALKMLVRSVHSSLMKHQFLLKTVTLRVHSAIPVLDKNTCERRLNILIFRNNFISLSTFPEYESKGMF
jgi:hypothetical protein